ncbi:DUF2306 domain-containing protein [Paenibacillus sp. LMG 31456]|uniref:DUF2306 domain-containing protein n=1 Tax=Paenibacillus foliorum TaxID=2654974 RepID=A0A972K1I9_9BACL|nr:DUF2306 domain-containing protein [Paenibacillus foliorum]NOU96744.1 DUF2306 domain-containing protein [Paenibacillus foliorum]
MSKTAIRTLVIVLALAISAYAIIQYGFFAPQKAGLISIKLRNPDFHLDPWIYALYTHIVTAVLALVIGPFQLFLKPRGTKPLSRHRLLGIVYVGAVTISGLVNLYLSMYATGGWISGLGFLLLDILWVGATWISVFKILEKNTQAHKEWMLRSYALTFAAVTLRIWLPLLIVIYHGSFVQAYQVVAWLCWIPNLLFIEAMIRLRSKRSGRMSR